MNRSQKINRKKRNFKAEKTGLKGKGQEGIVHLKDLQNSVGMDYRKVEGQCFEIRVKEFDEMIRRNP